MGHYILKKSTGKCREWVKELCDSGNCHFMCHYQLNSNYTTNRSLWPWFYSFIYIYMFIYLFLLNLFNSNSIFLANFFPFISKDQSSPGYWCQRVAQKLAHESEIKHLLKVTIRLQLAPHLSLFYRWTIQGIQCRVADILICYVMPSSTQP